jgi:hypothetical protein
VRVATNKKNKKKKTKKTKKNKKIIQQKHDTGKQ